MASLSLSGCSVRSQAVPGFRRPKIITPSLSPISLSFRIKGALRWQTGQRFFAAYASNSNPSGGDSIEEKSDGNMKSDANAQGPPFLTIVAGFFVFFLVVWIVGSVITWLISLIVNLASPK